MEGILSQNEISGITKEFSIVHPSRYLKISIDKGKFVN